MFEIFISVFVVLSVAFFAVQRMAARHIDLAKVSEDDRTMYDWFQTRVRPSFANIKPEGKKLLRVSFVLGAAIAIWMLGFAGYWIISSKPNGPAAERWGVGR